jgi:hypothetical protein
MDFHFPQPTIPRGLRVESFYSTTSLKLFFFTPLLSTVDLVANKRRRVQSIIIKYMQKKIKGLRMTQKSQSHTKTRSSRFHFHFYHFLSLLSLFFVNTFSVKTSLKRTLKFSSLNLIIICLYYEKQAARSFLESKIYYHTTC